MGKTGISIACDAGYHERAWRGCHAAQSVLHSEIIQSRKWNLKEEAVIQRQLKFEFKDTLFSMIIGWAINSAMILMAAATFYQRGENQVDDLTTAGNMLTPLLGNEATVIFAIALLLAGLSSSITAGMAGGTIFPEFLINLMILRRKKPNRVF